MKSSTAAMQAGHPHASVIGFALALAAGYVDTVGFVALFGLFTAHVTGNLVLIGAELANPSHGVLIKLLAFPAFLFAIAAARVIMIVALRSGLDAGPILLSIQTLLLLAFMLAGLLALPFDDSRSLLALTTGVLGSAAMGVQSAATKIVWGSPTPTTAMTGNVTQLVIDLVDMAWQGGGGPDLRRRNSGPDRADVLFDRRGGHFRPRPAAHPSPSNTSGR